MAFSRRRPDPHGRLGGRRHRHRLRLRADAGADRHAARPPPTPRSATSRSRSPARGPAVELPAVPTPRARWRRNLASAGFDGCSVSSNHALDFGEQGVVATLDRARRGRPRSTPAPRGPPRRTLSPRTYDVDGIAVAQLSYAYGFNGYVEPAGKPWLVDQIDPAVILADAQAARAAGRGGRGRVDALGQRVRPRRRRGAADGGRRARRRAGRRRPDRRAPRPRRAADLEGRRHVGGLGHGQHAVEQRAEVLPRRGHRRRDRHGHHRRPRRPAATSASRASPSRRRGTSATPTACSRRPRRWRRAPTTRRWRPTCARRSSAPPRYILALGGTDLGVAPDRPLP